ncbi:hypothetical protein AAVH_30070, partial [Aphelenchoides avenae]
MEEEDNVTNLYEIEQHLAQTRGARPLHVNIHAVFHHTVEENIEWTALNAQEFFLQMGNQSSDEPPEIDG